MNIYLYLKLTIGVGNPFATYAISSLNPISTCSTKFNDYPSLTSLVGTQSKLLQRLTKLNKHLLRDKIKI